QVAEGLNMAAHAKAPITDAFLNTGEAPADRAAAGMSALPEDTQGKYVQSVDVQDGVVIVTFGNEVNRIIDGLTLTLTPYETANLTVVWRCGNAAQPANTQEMGTAGNGNAATYIAPTVPNNYLPASCRD